jgi:hypothetical protein
MLAATDPTCLPEELRMPEAIPSSSSLGEAMLATAEHYRVMAGRCFWLARSATDPACVEALESLGRDYERTARQLWCLG